MIALLAALAVAATPGSHLADAKGRIHLSTSHLAQVQNWRDDKRECKSSFDFVAPGAATVRWTLDWKKVQTVQISTRKHFIEDAEAAMYQQQPGLILYGRETTSAMTPDGAKVAFDNLEFFLKDVTKMDDAFTGLRDYARACRRR